MCFDTKFLGMIIKLGRGKGGYSRRRIWSRNKQSLVCQIAAEDGGFVYWIEWMTDVI
jgi:hypothetical protein